jgi:hypothetical protein
MRTDPPHGMSTVCAIPFPPIRTSCFPQRTRMGSGDWPTTRPSRNTRCPPADAAVKRSPNPAAARSGSLPAGLATRGKALVGAGAVDGEGDKPGPLAEELAGAATDVGGGGAVELATSAGSAEAALGGEAAGPGGGELAETGDGRPPSSDQR